jgi:diadenosine tetraphosphatase ApaH/serine/threonine PP2A family protein phosphatase
LVHASPRDPLDEYVPADPTAWGARLHGWDVDYVCVGHTHQPFTLEVGKTKVINPGSVGLQRDGDPRARYAVIEPDGQVVLKKIDYDIDAVINAVNASPFESKAKNMLVDVYRSGKYLHPTTGMVNGTNGVAMRATA